MFGFGMSAKDKWHLNQAEVMMAPMAKLMGQDVKLLARQMFDATKAEVAAQYGEAIYAENLGDKLIATKKDFVEKRLAAGLSLVDIRTYWNQPMLMVALQNKFMEMSDFVALDMRRRMGNSMDKLANFARNRRKTEPRWGDPERWNHALPVNEGFAKEDADIYIEFYMRVELWREKTSEAEQSALLSKFSSYNAMLRDLIRKGSI
jgi:hypothetical protein